MKHSNPDYNKIAELAYRLWQDRGSPSGSPEEDWLRAEQELDGPRPHGEVTLSAHAMNAREI